MPIISSTVNNLQTGASYYFHGTNDSGLITKENNVLGGMDISGAGPASNFGAIGDYTGEIWFKPDVGITSGTMWGKGTSVGLLSDFDVHINAHGCVQVYLGNAGTQNLYLQWYNDRSTPVNDGEWHHLIWSYMHSEAAMHNNTINQTGYLITVFL